MLLMQEGQALVYQQTESDRDLAEGFFYFEPYPDINATGSRDFKIIAVDWRAEQITKTISYSVESAPPTIDPDDSILTPELSSTLLTNVDHNISALDEFGNNVTISLDKVFDESGAQHELTENSSLLGLKNEQYTFVYQVTDFRGVSTEVEKSLQASATPPTLTVPSFESNFSNTHYTSLDPKNIELSDPLDEWSAWLQSIISRNYLGGDIKQNIQVTVTTPEGSITNISFSELALPTFAGEWKYKFTIQDARLEDVRFPEEWSTTLTVESEQTLNVIASEPIVYFPDSKLQVELSSSLVSDVAHGLEVTDFLSNKGQLFLDSNGSITVDQVKLDGAEVNLDALSFNQLKDADYTFTYRITDTRGISRDFNQTVRVVATSPNLSVDTY